VNSGKAMSDKDPKHSALSRRERVCMNALLGIYLWLLAPFAFHWEKLPVFEAWQWVWSQTVQAALRGKMPKPRELHLGVTLSLWLAVSCLGLAFAAFRVGIRSLIRLRNLWLAAAVYAGGNLLLLAVAVREAGKLGKEDIESASIFSLTLALAIIGLRATRARERAEEASRSLETEPG
jgi:hypothetical protein